MMKWLLPIAGVVGGVSLITFAFIPGSAPARSDSPTTFTARPAASPRGLQPNNSAPIELTLPTVNVHADIRPVVTTNGVLGVPADPANIGWWIGSARPGSAAGSVVLDGHVDSAVLGIGTLSHLAELRANDFVMLETADGDSHAYRVYSRQAFVKHGGLPASLFATTGPPRLVLITCGGPFDQSTRSYEDNIVVFATPN